VLLPLTKTIKNNHYIYICLKNAFFKSNTWPIYPNTDYSISIKKPCLGYCARLWTSHSTCILLPYCWFDCFYCSPPQVACVC